MTALPEQLRIKLLNHFIGDVRAWKADDPDETVILGVKDPARDANNTSIYAMSRDGILTYLGTTALGKDGGVQPFVYKSGIVALLITEAPAPGDSGNLADLYYVVLQNRLPAASDAGTDTALANRLAAIEVRQEQHDRRLDWTAYQAGVTGNALVEAAAALSAAAAALIEMANKVRG